MIKTSSAVGQPSRVGRTLDVRPWPDPVLDTLGHDPRSAYVEEFWLGILGPTTTWLLRRLVAVLEEHPEGATLGLTELSRVLGLGRRAGRNGPLDRCIERAVYFEVARIDEDGALAVRRRLPPLTRRQVVRLPSSLQLSHQRWQESQPRAADAVRRRSRQLALSLIELGEDVESTERQLLRWRYHPALAHESAQWAWDRHRLAEQAAGDQGARDGAARDQDATAPGESAGWPYVRSSSTSVRTPNPVAPLVV
jgi:hypothetical protein